MGTVVVDEEELSSLLSFNEKEKDIS